MVHKWLRDPKFAPDPEIIEDEAGEAPYFQPVEIVNWPVSEEAARALAANAASGHSAIETDMPVVIS